MRALHFSAGPVLLAVAVMLTGCGKREISAEDRAKANTRQEAKTGMSAARLALNAKLQEQPKSAETRFELGVLLLAENDPKAAVIELKQAMALGHPNLAVVPVLAEAMVQSNAYKAVVDELGGTKLGNPEAQARLMASIARAKASLGDAGGAAKSIDEALALDPKSATAMLAKARLAAARNDIDTGLATLDTLLSQHPKSDAAWVLKGEMLQRRPGDAKLATQAFEEALKIQPKNATAMAALVKQHMAQGDMDGMRAQLAALKKQAPDAANTVYLEAHVAYFSGNHARARELFQALLKAMPENTEVLLSAGENEMKLDRPLQAEAHFAKALALAPESALARRLLAQAQIKLEQAPRALATLAPLVDRPDASADVLFLAGNASQLNGDAKAAEALYGRLAKLKPTDPQLRTAVAVAGFGKQPDEAVLKELQQISQDDRGTSADMAIIDAYQRKGQFDQALTAAAVLARKRPQDPMVPHLRGRLQLLKRDTAGARQSFDESLKINATYLPAISALAALDMESKQPDSARKRFNDLLKLQPANATALLALAEISTSQGATRAEVLKQLKQAVKSAPADVTVRKAVVAFHLNAGETEPALDAAQAAVAAYPDSPELLAMLAHCQVLAKQTQQAISTYGKMSSIDPKSAQPFLGMIDAHLANNDLDAAQRATDKLLEMTPDLPVGLARSALIAMRRNQPAAALAVARRLQAMPGSALQGLLLEGQVEFGRKNWDAAATVLRKATEQYQSGAAALLLHSALFQGGKVAAAKAMASDWLRAHPRDTDLLFDLGTFAEAAKDSAGAEKRYQEVLDINPNHPPALNNLAMLMVQQKRPGAVALAERAVEHAREKAPFLETLARSYDAEGNLDKAIAAQARALSIASTQHDWRLWLAKLHLRAGNKAAAKTELDRLAALGSANPLYSEVAELRDSLRSLAGR